jgi:hypothetical protein
MDETCKLYETCVGTRESKPCRELRYRSGCSIMTLPTALYPHSSHVFRVILTTRYNYVPIQHSQTCLLNGRSVLNEVRNESVYMVYNVD